MHATGEALSIEHVLVAAGSSEKKTKLGRVPFRPLPATWVRSPTGGVVSTSNGVASESALVLSAPSVAFAWTVCAPSVSDGDVMLHVPPVAVTLPIDELSTKTSTVEPASAVPEIVGVESASTTDGLLVAGAVITGLVGAIESKVHVNEASLLRRMPRSVARTVNVWLPCDESDSWSEPLADGVTKQNQQR